MENEIINIAGIICYKSQPENTRLATKEDFFLNGKLKMGMYYLIHAYHDNDFEAYKVNSKFNIKNIEPWLNNNRVFIKNI